MAVDPYAFFNAYNQSSDRRFQREQHANQLSQQATDNQRNRLRDMYLGKQQDAALQQQETQIDEDARTQVGGFARNILSQQMDDGARIRIVQQAVQTNPDLFKRAGIDASQIDWNNPQNITQGLEMAAAWGGQSGGDMVQSAQILANGNIAYLTRTGQLIDTGQKAKEQLQLTDVGGAPAVVNLRDRQSTAISTPEQERQAAAQQAAAVAGAQTSAQQQAQIRAIPERAAAEQAAERAGVQVQNQRTFNAYNTAMTSLKGALGATRTGPLSGRIPAVTAPQQTAEGAVAAVAPVLKQLFRAAGEGVFTDRDQQLLLDMVPKRTDHPEARAAKIEMIDQIVAAKLGIGETASPAASSGPAPAADLESLLNKYAPRQ